MNIVFFGALLSVLAFAHVSSEEGMIYNIIHDCYVTPIYTECPADLKVKNLDKCLDLLTQIDTECDKRYDTVDTKCDGSYSDIYSKCDIHYNQLSAKCKVKLSTYCIKKYGKLDPVCLDAYHKVDSYCDKQYSVLDPHCDGLYATQLECERKSMLEDEFCITL